MKGFKELVTEKEIRLANMLSQSRSSVFLESRGYIRKSLAHLFNLDPLDIPLEAHPSQPPKLPKEMGYISISHCLDALIIIWNQEKVGIDIERSDREFKYGKIAKKYFHNNQSLHESTYSRKKILNQWCGIEAAIKLDKGSLAKDLKQWKYISDTKTLFHKGNNLRVFLSQIRFYEWTISIAYENEKYIKHPQIICNNLNIF